MKKESTTNRWLFLTAFLDGLGGCGLYGVRTYRAQSRPSTDLEALRGDWLHIGEDFRGAAKKAQSKSISNRH
jgi:hypothetical protein